MAAVVTHDAYNLVRIQYQDHTGITSFVWMTDDEARSVRDGIERLLTAPPPLHHNDVG